jgi:hypothetical protein
MGPNAMPTKLEGKLNDIKLKFLYSIKSLEVGIKKKLRFWIKPRLQHGLSP